MTIVFDTNVLVSAFAARGLCYEIFFSCLDQFQLAVSPYILDEFETILTGKFKIPKKKTQEAREFVLSRSILVRPAAIKIKGLTDPKDMLVLSTAVAASAHFLISGDKALLSLGCIEQTRIISPRDFHILKLN